MAVIGVHEVLLVPSFKGGQAKIGRELERAAGPAGEQAGKTMGGRLGGALKAGLAVGGGAAIAGLGVALTKGFGRLSAIEGARAKLSGLGNSAKDVESIMTDALESVKGTAFGMDEAATVAASAVAAGIKPGKDLQRTLKLTGDAATIAGTDMASMGSIVNKVATSDMMQMDVANQLMDAGIPIIQMVAEEMGVTAEEARKMASEGKVSFETFQGALEDGLGGAALKSGETLQGAFKNSMAAIGRFGANLLEGVYPKIKEFFNAFQGWMGPVEELGKVIGERLGDAIQTMADWITGTALPALKDMGNWVRDNVLPVLQDLGAWIRDDVVPALQEFGGWARDNAVALAGFFGTLALFRAYAAYQAWLGGVTLATKLWTIAQSKLNLAFLKFPLTWIALAIAAVVGALIWAYNNVEWFRDGVNAAWAGIQSAISWAWQNVIQPVFRALSDFITGTLIPVISGFWNNVVKPVFGWIGERIKGVYEGVIRPTFILLRDIIANVLIPIIRAFWESHIKPTFQKIGGFIRDTWNNVIKPALDALGNFVSEHVAPKIERGIEIIRGAWEGIKRLFAEPINWVIRTVWNNGLKKAFDGVAKAVNSEARLGTIPEIALGDSSRKGNNRGTGGVTTVGRRAAGGNVHAGKPYLVGELGPEYIFPDRDGYVATARETAKMMAAGKDLPPDLAKRAAGRHPGEALAPMGDFNWGAAGDELKRQLGIGKLLGTDQLAAGVGQLAEFAKGILDPVMNSARSFLGGFGPTGQVALDASREAVKMVVDWATKKDSASDLGGMSGAIHEGPAGSFYKPSSGIITSRYGPRWGRVHEGIDIAAGAAGAAIRAAWNGVVAKTGWNIGPGRTGIGALLNHGNRWSYYGHMRPGTLAVRPGQKVKAGQQIGWQGTTGNSTGVHLHFEEHRGKAWNSVNPGYLFRDQGGVLPPGLNAVLNNTGGNEWIFNQDQLGKLNAAVSGGGGGDMHFHGPVGSDPREIAHVYRIERKRSLLAAGI